jgi:hypothetical protein
MTTNQLIAMLFPVLAGGAAVATGYAAIRWIGPRRQPATTSVDIYEFENGSEPPRKEAESHGTTSFRVSKEAVESLRRTSQILRKAERDIDEVIHSSNGGNF